MNEISFRVKKSIPKMTDKTNESGERSATLMDVALRENEVENNLTPTRTNLDDSCTSIEKTLDEYELDSSLPSTNDSDSGQELLSDTTSSLNKNDKSDDDFDALSIISDADSESNGSVFEDSDEDVCSPPPPPPPLTLDSSTDEEECSVMSEESDASDRGQLFLPNLLQSKSDNESSTPNSVSLLGPQVTNNQVPSPSTASSTTRSNSPLSLGKGALLLPNMFQRMRSKSNNSISSDTTNETGPAFSTQNKGVSSPAPITAKDIDRFPVPEYKEENRMLMRSPLPSPRTGPKRIVIPQPRTLADDSDSEDGRMEREETTMKRLVRMAKQQHNFATAWFATSAGEEPVLPAMAPRPKRRPRPAHPAVLNASSSSSRPVDLDMGDDDRSQVSGSTTSSASSRMRSFLTKIIPSASSINPDDSRGAMTPTTGSPGSSESDDVDLEAARSGTDKDGGVWYRTRSFYVILVFLTLCIGSVAAASVILAQRSLSGNDDGSASASSTFPPFPTRIPTMTPPFSPAPTMTMPSSEPTPSPSLAPSFVPSSAPSSVPTRQPSRAPSTAPSISPTSSPAPSSAPSMAPTSIFSTTVFELLGSTLQGNLAREQYGNSVSLSSDGTVFAIGARYYEHNGNRRAGRVQVFDLKGKVWAMRNDPLQSLFGRNDMDQFGFSVSLSGDGRRLAVAEPGFDGPAGSRSGNVRVFDWINGFWIQVGTDIGGQAATDLFGYGLTLSGNGQRLAVGAPYHDNEVGSLAGQVRIFEFSSAMNDWESLGNDLNGTQALDWFGWDIDLDWNGETVAIGAPRNSNFGGYVRCFVLEQDDSWKQVGNDIINNLGFVQLDDRFGSSVSLSADGQRVAVGAPGKDADINTSNSGLAAVYELGLTPAGQAWLQLGKALAGHEFNHQLGWSVELSSSGEFLSVGAPGVDENRGQVNLYRWNGNSEWDATSTPLQGTSPQDEFGFALAVSDDGSRVAVGAVEAEAGGAGYARVFEEASS